ncbi:molecular chaperone [Halocella sp. SP3-1]|uniref:molecular chaperone n=1 Tax=Halocella sp. SP3-1 TaxID=2382161 RepID=UPI000F764226|nr:molecular chaperone [Halocella sp. SP3-1]AZO95799.1 molecular chaperone [Halocella sp. SP3-1]
MWSYRLNPGEQKYEGRRFTRSELMEMSTYKLRNICHKYRIIRGYQKEYDRDSLIRIILKYRGVKKPNLIDEKKEGGFERVQNLVQKNPLTKLNHLDKIKLPAKITVYQEVGVNKEDQYKIIVENEIKESNVLLINGEDHLCGIFNLKKDKSEDNVYFLYANKGNLNLTNIDNKNYSFLFFRKNESEYIYKSYYQEKELPPINLYYYQVPIIDFEIKELEDTRTVLCIDFGTSNTTAGAYLDTNYVSSPSHNDILNGKIKINDINFVKFPYTISKEEKWIEIMPSVVYVIDCKDSENIKYLFGYEALDRMKKNDYSSSASVFQGIKRWVNNYQQEEEIYDEKGNISVIKRGEIIKAYINYVIELAEHNFKCKFQNIHISSPVKMKAQFLAMFEDIMNDYHIEKVDVLDEGISVLYNTIANFIMDRKFVDNKEYKALVIDCGGGTTDLSSCTFSIEEGNISYKVNIETGFENGDTNFGGNNITYRIMQYMKIVFANYYNNNGEIIDIDELIDIPAVDIFRLVDEMGVKEIYKDFEEKYREVENIIPTKFREYENKTSAEYQKVKNNFYFLWEIAENMKKQFFKKTNIIRNKFDSDELNTVDSDLHITSLNQWNLSIIDGQSLDRVNKFPNVVFNIKEISKLIKADIYEIVKKFLESFYESRELMNYSIIKLTGQSCKIDIFKEALKEFVPGRSIEFKQKGTDKSQSLELKLACLRGVIKYMKSKKLGDIEVSIKNAAPALPYTLIAKTFTGREKVVIHNQERTNQAKGFISKPISTEKIKFYLKSDEGTLEKIYIYENDLSGYTFAEIDEIVSQYEGKIVQEDTDNIKNGEIKFFVYTDENNWGFYVLPICRKEEKLHVGEKKYFAFEGDLSKLDFFDGLK